ncbi:uncharacterized protein PG998_011269 [Apiospora kogelbergensis]|uniref:Uncharacterized protein n=1 Tax=Apiospora kogelbergensis TaxID=1337665 RepID=A0AAW0RCH5_9PEZI
MPEELAETDGDFEVWISPRFVAGRRPAECARQMDLLSAQQSFSICPVKARRPEARRDPTALPVARTAMNVRGG